MATASLIDSNNLEREGKGRPDTFSSASQMAYGARTNHVEIDVDQTAMHMFVGFDGRRVITILPEPPRADFFAPYIPAPFVRR
jgi:hypothetical protein